MKNLEKLSYVFLLLTMAFTITSCKKDKDNGGESGASNSFSYQGKTITIGDADYRQGNGDGAWIYFTSKDYTGIIQVRFKGLANYAIPTGSFSYKSKGSITPYDPAKNFEGGQVGIDNVNEEFNGGTVKISRDGEQYVIDLDVSTKNGSLKGQFKGTLKKI